MKSAEGLEAGKTKIHYNGVDIGTISTIELSPDHRRVIMTAQMAPKTEEFLVADTKFWVVRPRISGANVSGTRHSHLGGIHRCGNRLFQGREERICGARNATGDKRRNSRPLLPLSILLT